MASFTTCHFEDFLSSTSKVTLPELDLDFGLNEDILFDSNCTEDSDFELPSVFPFKADSISSESIPYDSAIDTYFYAFFFILSVECLFVCALLAIAFHSNILNIFSQIRRYFTGYTLTFVGIKLPKYTALSTHSMFDRIDTTKTILTVHTRLLLTDTISDLKSAIRTTYKVPEHMDILIVFSHHIISNEALTLGHCGIEDRSLLTLALCEKKIVSMSTHWEEHKPAVPVSLIRGIDRLSADDEVYFDPVGINATFGMYESDSESEDEEVEEKCCDDCGDSAAAQEVDLNGPRLGFDVVMQEDSVTVYPMAGCGHVMNPDSLYHYALSAYSDKNTLSIKCPHIYGRDFPCKQRWDYHDILSVLRKHSLSTNTSYDLHKLELLASRNRVQSDCNVQKCPSCHTLYFKNDIDSANLGDIDSAEDVERAFKSECVYCSFVCTTYEAEYRPKLEVEQVEIENPDIPDLNLLNERLFVRQVSFDESDYDSEEDPVWNTQATRMVHAMFASADSDSESEESEYVEEPSLSDIEEEAQIIDRINSFFDDDEEEIIIPAWKLKLQSMHTWTKHKFSTMGYYVYTYTYPIYHYLSTRGHNQMVDDMITLTHDVDSYIHSKFTNTYTAIMDYIQDSLTYIRCIPSKISTFYNNFGAKRVVVLEISEFQEYQFMKIVPEPVEIYDLESEGMDLFDGGIFGPNSDTDSDSDSDSDHGPWESEEVDTSRFDGHLFGGNETDSDSDSDEELETLHRIENIFDADTPEPVMELVGYNKVTTVKNAFCFGCGKHWEEGHVCDSTFKQDLCDILTMADTKTIGEQQNVPSIRACPNCCQLITHTQACKHMDCRNCRKAFCFVCLKPRLDSGWQCGSYSSPCPGGVVPAQGMESLPDAIVLTKNAFHLY